jgi:hypothetical protein
MYNRTTLPVEVVEVHGELSALCKSYAFAGAADFYYEPTAVVIDSADIEKSWKSESGLESHKVGWGEEGQRIPSIVEY